MALIKCEECGKEISDKACFCPSCGAENRFTFCSDCNAKISKRASTCPNCGCFTNFSNSNYIIDTKGNYFGLSIAAFVLSFFGWLAILGLIFACVVLGNNNGKCTARGFAIASLIISVVWILFFFITIFQNI